MQIRLAGDDASPRCSAVSRATTSWLVPGYTFDSEGLPQYPDRRGRPRQDGRRTQHTNARQETNQQAAATTPQSSAAPTELIRVRPPAPRYRRRPYETTSRWLRAVERSPPPAHPCKPESRTLQVVPQDRSATLVSQY